MELTSKQEDDMIESGMEDMKEELKTLKDLVKLERHYWKIKKEAVKWIIEKGHIITGRDWCDFFNLSEEDLK